ncbi:MAG: DUF11 domain-containing protein [Desulfobacterales bacterium]|nr:DUF11 domain-containing protein [Desulfobacterales bacterium]
MSAAVDAGDIIEFTTTFFNKGTGALKNVVIYDQIPAHTDYVKVGAAGQVSIAGTGLSGVVYEIFQDGGITWSTYNSGAGTPDDSVTNFRACLTGLLNPGAQGSISFFDFSPHQLLFG